jgi:hypothetical protein
MFRSVSTYSFEGNLTSTLNSLRGLENTGLGLEAFSENYTESFVNPSNPNESPIRPNSQNQKILMDKPMSWWLENLNSGAIHYFPFTNLVNWAYTVDGNEIHIDREISDLIIPNETESSSENSVIYKEKFGLGRKDSQEQPQPPALAQQAEQEAAPAQQPEQEPAPAQEQ